MSNSPHAGGGDDGERCASGGKAVGALVPKMGPHNTLDVALDKLARVGLKLVDLDAYESPELAPFHSFYKSANRRGIFCSNCGVIGAFFCSWWSCRMKGRSLADGPFDFPGIRHGVGKASRPICVACLGRTGFVYGALPWVGSGEYGGEPPGERSECLIDVKMVPDFFTDPPRARYTEGITVPHGDRAAVCSMCSRIDNRKSDGSRVNAACVLSVGKGEFKPTSQTYPYTARGALALARVNALSVESVEESFGNMQSFYRDMFSPHNVCEFVAGLGGETHRFENMEGVRYCDVVGLQEHVATMLYCTLAFRRKVPSDVYDAALAALRIHPSWGGLGHAIPGGEAGPDFMARVAQFVVPSTYAPARAVSRREHMFGTRRLKAEEAGSDAARAPIVGEIESIEAKAFRAMAEFPGIGGRVGKRQRVQPEGGAPSAKRARHRAKAAPPVGASELGGAPGGVGVPSPPPFAYADVLGGAPGDIGVPPPPPFVYAGALGHFAALSPSPVGNSALGDTLGQELTHEQQHHLREETRHGGGVSEHFSALIGGGSGGIAGGSAWKVDMEDDSDDEVGGADGAVGSPGPARNHWGVQLGEESGDDDLDAGRTSDGGRDPSPPMPAQIGGGGGGALQVLCEAPCDGAAGSGAESGF